MARTGGTGSAAVLIAGPTASGKSALAMEIARRTGGIVVNADSMQVYRELAILTARPTPEDERAVPHALYGYRPAAEALSVTAWLADLAPVLRRADRSGQPAVIVGGTGLYLTALTRGLSEIPPIPDAVRAKWRAAAEARPAADLHADLAARDPDTAAGLRPSDTQRVLRALEVIEATGRPLSWYQGRRGPPLLPPEAIAAALVVAPEREALHRRIERRFADMVGAGGLEEARRFAALGLDPALPAMKAIGVPEMIDAALGRTGVDEAVVAAVSATRRYAKRQETWFRNQMPDWRRVGPGNILSVAGDVAQHLQNRG